MYPDHVADFNFELASQFYPNQGERPVFRQLETSPTYTPEKKPLKLNDLAEVTAAFRQTALDDQPCPKAELVASERTEAAHSAFRDQARLRYREKQAHDEAAAALPKANGDRITLIRLQGQMMQAERLLLATCDPNLRSRIANSQARIAEALKRIENRNAIVDAARLAEQKRLECESKASGKERDYYEAILELRELRKTAAGLTRALSENEFDEATIAACKDQIEAARLEAFKPENMDFSK
jgi:hypothetical protein